jgi:hypothetical protein
VRFLLSLWDKARFSADRRPDAAAAAAPAPPCAVVLVRASRSPPPLPGQFVKPGIMHRAFQPHVRTVAAGGHGGIDYTALHEGKPLHEFDVAKVVEEGLRRKRAREAKP